MSTFLQETLGVSDSGVMWDVGNFKLFQSTRPDIVLFMAKQPELVRDNRGKPQIAVSSYIQQQEDRSVKITGGAASFTISSAIQYEAKALKDVQDSWRAAMGLAPTANVRFVPLNVQKGLVRLNINDAAGKVHEGLTGTSAGTPGGSVAFLVDLTELGAQAWVQGIKNRTPIPGSIEYRYQYLRNMPPVGATVKVWGKRVYKHFSAALDVSYNGFFYGGSAKLEAAWNDLQRNGDVEIVFYGDGLPPELEKMRQELTKTFAEQGRRMLFDQIFAPMEKVAPAKAGDTSGIFGGANFAMKWQRDSDAIDLEQKIEFRGLTWIDGSMDTDLSYLFRELGPENVTEVQTQQAFDSVVLVESDPMLANVAMSISYSEGHSPEAPVFNSEGGNQRYTVFSQKPDEVTISYTGKVDYAPPRWPIIPISGSAKVKNGGNQIMVKTSQWVGRHEIYMFVRDGDRIVSPMELTEDDYLILNVSYSAPHLGAPVRDSAHLSALSMVEFSYPMDPQGRRGEAKFSAFGVIGGKLVRAADQVIAPDETAVFVLVSRDGTIQLVSKNTVLPESDRLAQSLLEGQARPVVTVIKGEPIAETEKSSNGAHDDKDVSGTVVAVEYGFSGPALWIETDEGKRRRVRLRREQEADPFDDAPRHVRVRLDESGTYADALLVELNGN